MDQTDEDCLHIFSNWQYMFVEGDDCFNHECEHGQCVDEIGYYSCNCNATGFEGDKCQQGMSAKYAF